MVHWLLLVVKVIAGTSDCDLYNNVIAPALGATTNATRCCDGSTSICTKDGRITKLKLDGLDLVGFIPPELAQITLLDSLDLSENNFCAQPIPDLGGLVNLKSFVAGNSYLSGSLSPWISKLVNLETLEIQENNLNGTVAELGQLTNLKNVSLNSNSFTGTVPQFNQSALQTLDLGLNYFDASDLSWISNLTSLTVLNMDGIPIKGPIPSQLARIILSNCQITGQIPTDLKKLTSLHTLKLNSNQLEGSIPVDLSLMPALASVELDFNYLVPTSGVNLNKKSINRFYSQSIPNRTTKSVFASTPILWAAIGILSFLVCVLAYLYRTCRLELHKYVAEKYNQQPAKESNDLKHPPFQNQHYETPLHFHYQSQAKETRPSMLNRLSTRLNLKPSQQY